MTTPHSKKTPKKTLAKLEQELFELRAQLVHNYHFADATLDKASEKRMGASAVIIQLTALGGAELIPPVAIKNGLSQATIDAIRADLQRSYVYTAELKPKGV